VFRIKAGFPRQSADASIRPPVNISDLFIVTTLFKQAESLAERPAAGAEIAVPGFTRQALQPAEERKFSAGLQRITGQFHAFAAMQFDPPDFMPGELIFPLINRRRIDAAERGLKSGIPFPDRTGAGRFEQILNEIKTA
jgi:hypothetical protein